MLSTGGTIPAYLQHLLEVKPLTEGQGIWPEKTRNISLSHCAKCISMLWMWNVYAWTDGRTNRRTNRRTEQLLAIALSKTEDLCAKTEYVKKLACVLKISLKLLPILGYGIRTKYETQSIFCLTQDGWIRSNISIAKHGLCSLVCAIYSLKIVTYVCKTNLLLACFFVYLTFAYLAESSLSTLLYARI